MTGPVDRRLDGLQALRFVAAGLVIITHAMLYTSERLAPVRLWSNGTLGVDIFFVISGFVMVWSSRPLVGQADGWRIFARKRIDRIVPLYWTITLAKVAMMLTAGSVVLHSSLTLEKFVKSLLFIPYYNGAAGAGSAVAVVAGGEYSPLLGVGWTLNFEMFFYAVFAFAMALRRGVLPVCAAILVALAAASLVRPVPYSAPWFYADSIVVEFLAGMIIAEAFLRGVRLPQPVAIALVLTGFAILLVLGNPLHLPRGLAFGIPAAMVVAGVVALEPHLRPVLPRPVLFLGNASYAIYLVHPLSAPFGAVILARLHVPWPAAGIALCWLIGVGAGCLVHRFVEPVIGAIWKTGLPDRRAVTRS